MSNKNNIIYLQTLSGWSQANQSDQEQLPFYNRRILNIQKKQLPFEDIEQKLKSEISQQKPDLLIQQVQKQRLGRRMKSFQNNTLRNEQTTLNVLPGIKTDRDPHPYRRQSKSVYVHSVYSHNNEKEVQSVDELKKLREFLQSETLNLKYDSHKQYSNEGNQNENQKTFDNQELNKSKNFFIKQQEMENVFKLTDISNQYKKKPTRFSLPKFAINDKSSRFLKKNSDYLNMNLNMTKKILGTNQRIKLSDLLNNQKIELKLTTKKILSRENQFIQDEIYSLQEIRQRRKCISTMEQNSKGKYQF